MTTMPADRRRRDERITFEAYLRDCPFANLMAAVSNRWMTLIVCALGEHEEPLRYNQLSREMPGISQKMMTQTLRSLEREGLITRTATLDVPVRVEYSLTEMGRSFLALLFTFRDWAESNIGRVDEARARYDAAAGTA